MFTDFSTAEAQRAQSLCFFLCVSAFSAVKLGWRGCHATVSDFAEKLLRNPTRDLGIGAKHFGHLDDASRIAFFAVTADQSENFHNESIPASTRTIQSCGVADL